MAKCEPAWKALGGKTRSRSNFWKTSNDRFIIKTLVNAWNIDQFSHQPRALLFPVYNFGHRNRSRKGRPCRDREFILQPKAYENVRPQRYLGP
ncbi:hypothetical protein BGY98DRAFT_267943 [Russula aff. rugulosa BPL654]|nr:hypothetical protein BGY98DRAFT_267943 [Russula aff. rugulosa BPL654]